MHRVTRIVRARRIGARGKLNLREGLAITRPQTSDAAKRRAVFETVGRHRGVVRVDRHRRADPRRPVGHQLG